MVCEAGDGPLTRLTVAPPVVAGVSVGVTPPMEVEEVKFIVTVTWVPEGTRDSLTAREVVVAGPDEPGFRAIKMEAQSCLAPRVADPAPVLPAGVFAPPAIPTVPQPLT